MATLHDALPSSLITVSVSDWYKRNIESTDEEIAAAKDCTQKSELWMKVRSNRVTGSRFSVALGHSYPYSPEKPNSKPPTLAKAICEFVWPEPVKGCAVNWGNHNEENARMVSEVVVRRRLLAEFGKENVKSITFSYPGTIVCKEAHWVSVSPDGLVKIEFTDPERPHEDALLEFKCPYARNEFYDGSGGGIPLYYFDQIQGSMGFLRMDGYNMKRCFFSVWTREKTQISEFLYEEDYFENTMLPWTKSFYFDELLPRFVLKSLNILPEGEIQLLASSFPAIGSGGGGGGKNFGPSLEDLTYKPPAASASDSSRGFTAGENPYKPFKRKETGLFPSFPMKRPALQQHKS